MKKILIFVLIFGFSRFLLSQTISEKFIASFPNNLNVDGYSFNYGQNSGNYVYTSYDTLTRKYIAYTDRGSSDIYDFITTYNALFDKEGNCYFYAYNYVSDTTYLYHILENGKVIAKYDLINESWLLRDNIIYFVSKDKDKAYLTKYNTDDGSITKDNPYDDISLVYLSQQKPYYEGEPVGQLGFTADNKPYYLAALNNEKFIVAGSSELKHYSDIDMYSVIQDKNGSFTYFAKDSGKYYEPHGKSFLVQGDKEYKKYDYLYAPILFDDSNNPVYISGDSAGSNFPQRVMVGNSEEKSFNGGISDLKFTPSGKLAYIAYSDKKGSKGPYQGVTVIDGKEGKVFNDINNFTFTKNDEPLYFASDDRGAYIMAGNKITDIDFPSVLDLKVLPNGMLIYTAAIYGDNKKKTTDQYFVIMGDATFGPYEGLQPVNYEGGPYVLSDDAGNYAYISTKLIDPKNYVYQSVLYTKSGKSKAFDFIQNLSLYKGKAFYIGGVLVDKVNYGYEYTIYYGNTKIGSYYDNYSSYKFDDSTGVVSFYGMRANSFYAVEIKL